MPAGQAGTQGETPWVVIGLDVGGSRLKGALLRSDGTLVGDVRQADARSGEPKEVVLSTFTGMIQSLMAGAGDMQVAGIGIAMPGPFDYERGISYIRGLGKYEALYGINVGEALRDRLGLDRSFPVRFLNDAEAFARGEWRFGAARGRRRVMVLTFGTGCGSAFLADGKVLRGGPGVPPDGYVYGIPFRGATIDDWLSARGILRLWQGRRGGGAQVPAGVQVKDLAARAEAGDAEARALFREFGWMAGEALRPIAAAFQPDCIVIGGGISKGYALFGPQLVEALGEWGAVVTPATHPDEAAVLGAATLVLELASSRPSVRRPIGRG